MNTIRFVEGILRDARHALRTIRLNPGFSSAAILSLALGIGANTAIFSVVNAILIRPLPYPASERLVGVANRFVIQGQVFEDAALSPGMYDACKQNARTFDSFGVWTSGAATLAGAEGPEQLVSVTLTQGVLPAFGVLPHIGRWFSTKDDSPGSPETVILSHGYWQRKFGGDAAVLGRTVLVDFLPREVIGVMPREFRFLDLAPEILLPQRFSESDLTPDRFNHNGIARLKPGVTMVQANDDVARVWNHWGQTARVGKMLEMVKAQPNLRPLKRDVVGNVGSVLTVVMGALGLVLLLVCANVANLVLVRVQSRRQEFAVRAALGASWGSLAREILVESLVLSFLGGALGVALAYAGLRLLVQNGPAALPRLAEISMDGSALGSALVYSLGSGLLFGLVALLRCGIGDRIGSARGATQGPRQLRTQNVLVVSQIAIAFVLSVASGLMIRSFLALHAVQPGFTQPERIQTLRIAIPEALASDPERVIRMQAEIVTKLAALPGAEAAGFASGLPLESEYRNGVVIGVEGKTSSDQMPPNRAYKQISPGLLATQGTRLIAGRDFTWEEVFSQRRVAIVSANMARESWGEPVKALGKRIVIGRDGPWTEVVGVAEDVHTDGLNRPAPATVYARAGLERSVRRTGSVSVRRSVTFAIRSERAGTEAFVREAATAIHSVNPHLPLAKVRTLHHVYRQSMAQTSFALVLLGISGVMAFTLASVGVYGVLGYAVAQRRREVGIRIALGAEPKGLKWLFVRQGLVLNCIGGIAGIAAALSLSRWIASLVFGVTVLDLPTYAASAGLIAFAVVAASYIPARQAARVDPMETLRAE